MAYADFGKSIKQQYPGSYDDLDDNELGLLVSEKYPDMFGAYQTEKVGSLQASQGQAEKEANKSVFRRFVTGLPKAATEVGVGIPAKFATSVAEVPGTFKRGYASGKTYDLPGLEPFQSYISEAQTRGEQIVTGEKPLHTALAPFAEVPVAALETVGVGKIANKAVQKTTQVLAKTRARKALNEALEATEPVLGKKEAIKAFETAGRPGGVTEKGIISKKYARTPSAHDVEVAQSVQGIVRSRRSPVKNLQAVNSEISRISEKEIKPFLRANPRPFNNATLNARLEAVQPPTLFKADATIENSYNLVKRRIMDILANSQNKHTMEGLWETRKDIDNMMEQEFGEAIFNPEKGSAVKRAYLDMRRVMNDFIAESTGDNTFKAQMKKLSNMYEARANIAEQNYKYLNTGRIKRFITRYPKATKALVGATGLSGLGYGLSRAVKKAATETP